MDKLKMQTANKADENFKKLAEMFPNAVTETIDENGEVVRAIDKDVLMQEINTKVVDGNEERYQFTWPDKKKSVLLANAPINKTLRPCREESVDFDNTENLYIEGDNLEVLKLLQETYLGKIKMIYIDPPYNTGNDFVYEDDFAQSTDEYLANSGQFDEDGNRLVKNLDSNGRFHTDWLNMIYPRLKIAKDLLTETGCILISINDKEYENIHKVLTEIFGQDNVDTLIWQKTDPWVDRNTNAKQISRFLEFKEYVFIAYKNKVSTTFNKIYRMPDWKNAQKNPDKDYRGNWQSGIFSYEEGHKNEDKKSSSYFTITTPGGKQYTRMWFCENYYEYKDLESKGYLYFGSDGNSAPRKKVFENLENEYYMTSILRCVGTSGSAKDELIDLFDSRELFDTPKPTKLLKELIRAVTEKDDIVLDFFSGSATTAHAVMQLNAEDGGHRKFVMVQLPEETDEKSEAYKAGYKNICEIGKERIRRAGQKIRNEQLGIRNDADNSSLLTPNSSLDIGFRVLKCDSSNMKEVYYNPAEYEPSLFSRLEDNIKEDRTPEDLLFQVMLDLGVLLSSKIEATTIAGKKVFNVEENYLIACFDDNVTEEVITEIAKQKPYYFVMRDSSMANDSVATNFEQIFAAYSPDTVRKVL